MSKKLLTFKMFLEGGAATQEQGTQRVSQSDIQSLIPIITEVLGISEQDVKNQFVGSTPLVLSGDKQDSGDIDFITTSDSQEDKDRIVQAFTDKFGEGKKIGESIFSFAAVFILNFVYIAFLGSCLCSSVTFGSPNIRSPHY